MKINGRDGDDNGSFFHQPDKRDMTSDLATSEPVRPKLVSVFGAFDDRTTSMKSLEHNIW